jgi:hypothetical protein
VAAWKMPDAFLRELAAEAVSTQDAFAAGCVAWSSPVICDVSEMLIGTCNIGISCKNIVPWIHRLPDDNEVVPVANYLSFAGKPALLFARLPGRLHPNVKRIKEQGETRNENLDYLLRTLKLPSSGHQSGGRYIR